MDSILTRNPPALVETKVLDRSAKRLHRELVPKNVFKKFDLKNDRKDIEIFYFNLRSKFIEDGILKVSYNTLVGRNLFYKLTELKMRVTDVQSTIIKQKSNFRCIKKVLNDVEQALSDYFNYEQERMQELIKMELSLWQDCTIFAERIEFWKHYSSHQMRPPAGPIRSQEFNLTKDESNLPEVFDFQAEALSARLPCERNSVAKTRLQSAPSSDRQQQRARVDVCHGPKYRETGWRLEVARGSKEEKNSSEERKPQKRIQELRAHLEVHYSKIGTVGAIQTGRRLLHCNMERGTGQCLTEFVKERIQEDKLHLMRLQLERKRSKPRALGEREACINRRNPEKAIGYTELWGLRVQALKSKEKLPQP
ncbi:hypothetical protein EGR_04720 [Echinococcus granulosus]|uniref:Uncharacterized protein n=2 Tax=Echinococcus granulosus TaxID=6210 RepID=W6UH45_ECHGR|nr:hypothetical protein EGR_04720 [Echinococcus granulosus]EUB60338.1 hypothetical protein EGR_04720 [Echinococcus granulosus]